MGSNSISDWGAAIKGSFQSAFSILLSAIPKIIGFLVILLVGWWITGLIARAIVAVLRRLRFNDIAQRSGFDSMVSAVGMRTDGSTAVANVVKWFLRIIVLMASFDALGLPVLSQLFAQFLLWIPNLIVALAVLVIGGLAARALGDLVRGMTARAGITNPNVLALVTRVAVMGFAVVIAVNEIGVGAVLVNTLFIGLVATIALAFGLAFGLGGQESARQALQSLVSKGRETMPRVRAAANSMSREKRPMAPDREFQRGNGEPMGSPQPNPPSSERPPF